jgi:hypothetical protein
LLCKIWRIFPQKKKEKKKKKPTRPFSKKNKNFLKIFQKTFSRESPTFVGKKPWACPLGSFEKLS